MIVRFYIDPETGLAHCLRHGVTETEARQAIRHRREDRPAHEGSRSLIGYTDTGRILRVIYAKARQGPGIFVITAYDLKGKPLQAFRRRQRKRGR